MYFIGLTRHLVFQLDEIEDKDVKLRMLSDEQQKHRKLQYMSQDKAKKEVTVVKKQLSHERNMKLDAFQRVDELQTAVSTPRVY